MESSHVSAQSIAPDNVQLCSLFAVACLVYTMFCRHRMIDDIFKIRRELIVIVVLGLIQSGKRATNAEYTVS